MARIKIRPAASADAQGILESHYSAVHETARRDYPDEILDAWSTPVTPERIRAYLENALPRETTVVAEVEGRVVGFGSIVESSNELRAVYISDTFRRKGVGSALLQELENLAKERGCKELTLDSSLTAERFYLQHGYTEMGRGDHKLSSGHQMACVRMRKILD